MAIHDSIPSLQLPSPESMELVTVLVQIPHPVILCLVYLPPQASANEVQSLINFLSNLISTQNVILLGDFNFPNIDWSSLSSPNGPSHLFTEFAFRANLSQHITTPTHIGGNILDLLFSQSPDSVINVQVHNSQPLSNFSSDHFPISFSIPHSALKLTPNHPPSFYLDFAKCNYDAMVDHLLDIDFSDYFSSHNIEYLWSFLKNILKDSIASFVPKVRRSSQKFPKWFTGQIRHHLNQLRSLRRKARVTKDHSAKLSSSEAMLQEEISIARSNYEAALVDKFAFSNDNTIYSYIRSLLHSNSLPNVVSFGNKSESSDEGKACLFNSFFHSVFLPDDASAPLSLQTPAQTLNSIEISIQNVFSALVSLNPSKATGIDGIPAHLLKSCATPLCEPIHHLFVQCFA